MIHPMKMISILNVKYVGRNGVVIFLPIMKTTVKLSERKGKITKENFDTFV